MSMPMHPGSIVRILEHLRHAIHFGGLIMPIASHGHAQFSDFRTVIMDDDPFPLVYHNWIPPTKPWVFVLDFCSCFRAIAAIGAAV